MMSAHNLASDLSPDPSSGAREAKEVTVFRIPIGRLGLIASVLIGVACGFIAFFITFFLAIIGVSIYDTATGTSMLNLTISYRYIAAPVGILVMFACLTYLITLWVRRKLAGGE